MSERLKLAGFGIALAVVFAAALGVGALAGGSDPTEAAESTGAAEATGATGLSDSAEGYTLADLTAPTEPGVPGALRFRITGPGGVVTDFATRHEEKLHLIVVRDDATEYRHVHPVMDPSGTWSLDWTWAEPGTYRVFADFTPEGAADLVLSRTVTVAGTPRPQPLPPPATVARVHGYEVTLAGTLSTAGGELTFTVRRDGAPVTDLDPYLGAYAHLVALRAEDLAYLHVHPEGEIGRTPPGPEVSFHAQAPSAGDYRLYLEFEHRGQVHAAEFTVPADASAPPSGDGHDSEPHEHGTGGGHGHG